MRLEPSTWAAAVASSGARHDDAMAAYARLRMQRLASQAALQRGRTESLDDRRRNSCLRAKITVDAPLTKSAGRAPSPPLPPVSLTWLGILLVSTSGTAGSAGRLLGGGFPPEVDRWIPGIAILFGCCVVTASLWLRRALPARTVKYGWDSGLALVCAISSFASLYCGWKLMHRTSPEILQALVTRETKPVKGGTSPEAKVLTETGHAGLAEISEPFESPQPHR